MTRRCSTICLPIGKDDYLRLIDTHTSGNRCDLTPLFADPEGFTALLDDLERLLEGAAFDVVAGIDALGFVVGAALAARRGAGFLAIRKGGKLPVATVSRVSPAPRKKQLSGPMMLWIGAPREPVRDDAPPDAG